uniref:Ig-like domain-containing protein n=1 Tax=Sander lucioperca TaxID=283035 RepID=A0A8D0ART8_SANLU
MCRGKCVVVFVVLTFLWTFNRADDIQVSCDFMESCILPCRFRSGDEVVIHWIQKRTKDTQAHSYYHNQDQLGLQDQRFRGRTSLFKDQISRGNASLRLTGVEVQDQGRYKCYTSTITGNKESYINLNVDAPVDKVDIQQVENRITCSSEGIFPQPELTWSTSPPSNVSLENNPTVQQTEQLLYNINSSLIASVTDLVYSCTVSTRTNKRTATLFKLTSISGSDTETTIPCESLNPPLTGLVWRFNHSQIILKPDRSQRPLHSLRGVEAAGEECV